MVVGVCLLLLPLLPPSLPLLLLGKPRKVERQKKEGGKAPGWAPEIMPKHRKSLPNGRQQGGAFGAAPRGRRFAPPPWGSCCLPFGKDFLCFWCISGALLDLHGPPSPLWKLRPRSALVGPPPLFRHLQYLSFHRQDPLQQSCLGKKKMLWFPIRSVR